MRLSYEPVEHWPPLSWLARCDGQHVHVRHGRKVEIGDGWFGEVAWDGSFQDGDFDRTDIVAGSGGRLRGTEIIFVPPGSTVDRLQYWHDGDQVLVSNSLPCLLAQAGLDVDMCHRWYFEDLKSVIRGLGSLKDRLDTTGGPVRLAYFDNLVWNGSKLEVRAKPSAERQFPDYETYRDFLATCMATMVDNMRDPARVHAYGPLTTLSSGYDSSAVAVVAREAGCTEALTFHPGREGVDDRGSAVAETLGISVYVIDRHAWRSRALVEVPFVTGNAHGQDVAFSGAEPLLSGRVLFTGYHGDAVWDKRTEDLGPTIVRHGFGGLSLTEYRLWAGFLHAPVPFWGVRQIRQLHAISNSPEMKPWDVPGNYSRPIARRIVEEAGVPREAFGTGKRMASVQIWDPASTSMLTESSFEDYRSWLAGNAAIWLRRGRVPPLLEAPVDRGLEAIRQRFETAPWRVRRLVRPLPIVRDVMERRKGALFRHLFPWALARAKGRYLNGAEAGGAKRLVRQLTRDRAKQASQDS